ncbi:MAG: hypothetical protein P8Y42_20990, partial [Exilibacterium sp.]
KNFRLGGPTSSFCNDARRDASEATLYKTKRGSYSVPVPYFEILHRAGNVRLIKPGKAGGFPGIE